MRISGIIRLALVALIDFIIVYALLGILPALTVTAGIMLYAWLGEYIALARDRAVGMKKMTAADRIRLTRLRSCLAADVRRVSNADISRLKLHVIPSDTVNAYAYGFGNVGVTRTLLDSCDDTTVCAVLAHEVSHILCLDAVFYRAVFANVAVLLGFLTVGSFVSAAVGWVLFIILCACGVCGGIISLLVFNGITRLIRGAYSLLQRFAVFVFQTVMGIVNRRSEFRADGYSCSLGYSRQLSYFLTRFVQDTAQAPRTLTDVLYSTHPTTYKRLSRIEQLTA